MMAADIAPPSSRVAPNVATLFAMKLEPVASAPHNVTIVFRRYLPKRSPKGPQKTWQSP